MKSRDIQRSVRAQRFDRSAGDAPSLGRVARVPGTGMPKGDRRRRRRGEGGRGDRERKQPAEGDLDVVGGVRGDRPGGFGFGVVVLAAARDLNGPMRGSMQAARGGRSGWFPGLSLRRRRRPWNW